MKIKPRNGRTLKKYYCKLCSAPISMTGGLYKSGLCRLCSEKRLGQNMLGSKNNRFGKKPIFLKNIKYNGISFRSTWEVAYAKWLDKQNIKWQYEPKIFNLGKMNYIPDFYLPETDIYIEIKGYWMNKAKEKFELLNQKFPNIKIILLQEQELKKLKII